MARVSAGTFLFYSFLAVGFFVIVVPSGAMMMGQEWGGLILDQVVKTAHLSLYAVAYGVFEICTFFINLVLFPFSVLEDIGLSYPSGFDWSAFSDVVSWATWDPSLSYPSGFDWTELSDMVVWSTWSVDIPNGVSLTWGSWGPITYVKGVELTYWTASITYPSNFDFTAITDVVTWSTWNPGSISYPTGFNWERISDVVSWSTWEIGDYLPSWVNNTYHADDFMPAFLKPGTDWFSG